MQGTAPILYHFFRSRHYNLDTFDYHKRSVANCLCDDLKMRVATIVMRQQKNTKEGSTSIPSHTMVTLLINARNHINRNCERKRVEKNIFLPSLRLLTYRV